MIKFNLIMLILESILLSLTLLPTMPIYYICLNTTSDRALVKSLDDELVAKL